MHCANTLGIEITFFIWYEMRKQLEEQCLVLNKGKTKIYKSELGEEILSHPLTDHSLLCQTKKVPVLDVAPLPTS